MSEEKDEDLILHFGFAENSLSAPVECIRHVFKEMIKVGHTVEIYTYFGEDKPGVLQDLRKFVEALAVPEITKFIPRAECIAEVYYDERNFGNTPGFMNLFGSLIRSGVILSTSQNDKLMRDVKYWSTGTESSGIINPAVPKLISLDEHRNGN